MADQVQIARLMSPTLALLLIALGAISYALAWWWSRRTRTPSQPHTPSQPPPMGEESANLPSHREGQGVGDYTNSALSTQHPVVGYERDVLAVGGIVAAIIGFFWQPLFQNNVWLPLGGGDFTSFYYPLYSFASRSLQAGIFPFWNPSLYAGMPYAADIQTAALYPPTLLTLWLGQFSYGTLELLVIFHYALAATFMYAFLRHGFGLHRAACVLGGLAFACCGFMTAHFGHVPMVPVASWLPLAMLGAKLATERDSLRWAAVTGLALAMSALGGHAQIFFYVALTVGLWWLWLLFGAYRTPSAQTSSEMGGGVASNAMSEIARLIISPIVAAVVFGLIAAPQLLLSNELGNQSVRAGISYNQAATDFTTQPIGLLWTVLPHVWGSNPQSYWSLGNWASTETWAYGGVITLLLVALAFVGRPTPSPSRWEGNNVSPSRSEERFISGVGRDSRWFFAALAIISLLLTLGGGVTLFGWLFSVLPEWDKFRSVGRLLLPFGFATATLAAFGAARLFEWAQDIQATILLRRITFVLLACAGVIAGVALPIFLARVTEGTNIERSIPFANDLIMLIVWLAAFAGLVWYARSVAIAPATAAQGVRWLVTMLLAVFIIDLFSVNAAFNPTTTDNTSGFQHPAAVKLLQSDASQFRIDSDTGVGNLWQPSLAELYGLQDASGIYNPLKPARYDQLYLKARQDRTSNLYSMMNIKYVVGMTDTRTLIGAGFNSDNPLRAVYSETTGLTIYRNLNAFARAYIVHSSVVEPDAARQFALVTDSSFNPRRSLALDSGDVLSGTMAISSRYNETDGANPETGEATTITDYSPNQVTISTTVKQDGYLVLTDVYYPGWSATLDRQPATIVRANYAFRAVRVTPGQHIITMSFTPRIWWVGLGAMALGLLLAAALLIFGGRIRLRQPAINPHLAD